MPTSVKTDCKYLLNASAISWFPKINSYLSFQVSDLAQDRRGGCPEELQSFAPLLGFTWTLASQQHDWFSLLNLSVNNMFGSSSMVVWNLPQCQWLYANGSVKNLQQQTARFSPFLLDEHPAIISNHQTVCILKTNQQSKGCNRMRIIL